MIVSGSLFGSLFEFVDCGGQHELVEFAVQYVKVDSEAKPTLEGRKGNLDHPRLAA